MPKNDGSGPEQRKLRKLLKGFRVAMLTTVGPGGSLRSRPMVTARAQEDGDVWFLTKAGTPKIGDVEGDSRVNIGYASEEEGRYVSLSGIASLVRDPQQVLDLWRKRHRKWFPEGKRDPELAAMRVRVDRAEYWDERSGQRVVFSPAGAPAGGADEPGAASRIADAMKALVTGSEDQAEEKPPTQGGAQGGAQG